jgi:hypothetical protein
MALLSRRPNLLEILNVPITRGFPLWIGIGVIESSFAGLK